MRKPKGWYRRFEIEYGEVTLLENTEFEHKAMRWRVSMARGRNYGFLAMWQESGRVSGAPVDIADADLIRRAGLDNVTVPVIIKRPAIAAPEGSDELASEIIYGSNLLCKLLDGA